MGIICGICLLSFLDLLVHPAIATVSISGMSNNVYYENDIATVRCECDPACQRLELLAADGGSVIHTVSSAFLLYELTLTRSWHRKGIYCRNNQGIDSNHISYQVYWYPTTLILSQEQLAPSERKYICNANDANLLPSRTVWITWYLDNDRISGSGYTIKETIITDAPNIYQNKQSSIHFTLGRQQYGKSLRCAMEKDGQTYVQSEGLPLVFNFAPDPSLNLDPNGTYYVDGTRVQAVCSSGGSNPMASIILTLPDGSRQTGLNRTTSDGVPETVATASFNVSRANPGRVACVIQYQGTNKNISKTFEIYTLHIVQLQSSIAGNDVAKGNLVTLTCLATEGMPPFVKAYNWTHCYSEYLSADRCVTISNSSSRNTFEQVTYQHSGNYTCAVQNEAGHSTQSNIKTVRVLYAPVLISQDALTIKERNKNVPITVTIRAYPIDNLGFTWEAPDGRVKPSEPVLTGQEEFVQTISPFEILEEGEHRCNASTSFGFSIFIIKVTIDPDPEPTDITMWIIIGAAVGGAMLVTFFVLIAVCICILSASAK